MQRFVIGATMQRLAQLEAGFSGRLSEPDNTPASNVPRASGIGFHFLTSILGLDADAYNNILFIYPVLPHGFPRDHLKQPRRRASTVMRFWREDDEARYDVLSSTTDSTSFILPKSSGAYEGQFLSRNTERVLGRPGRAYGS